MDLGCQELVNNPIPPSDLRIVKDEKLVTLRLRPHEIPGIPVDQISIPSDGALEVCPEDDALPPSDIADF